MVTNTLKHICQYSISAGLIQTLVFLLSLSHENFSCLWNDQLAAVSQLKSLTSRQSVFCLPRYRLLSISGCFLAFNRKELRSERILIVETCHYLCCPTSCVERKWTQTQAISLLVSFHL